MTDIQEASDISQYESDAREGFSSFEFDVPARDARILSAVVCRANEMLAKSSAAKLGPLSVVAGRYMSEYYVGPQLRSAPLRGLGGAEFRFDVPRGGDGVHPADCLGTELIVAACRHLGVREPVKLRVKEAKNTVTKALKRHLSQFSPVKLTAIGVDVTQAEIEGRMIIELDMLGHDLVMRSHRICESGLWTLEEDLEKVLTRHDARARLLATCRANHSRGSIEETARLLIFELGLDMHEALHKLERQEVYSFYFDGRRQYGTLKWREGVLKGSFHDNITHIGIENDVLSFHHALPETIMIALVGRRVSEAIQSHPLVPSDAIVVAADSRRSVTNLTLAIPWTPLPICNPDRTGPGR